MQPDFYLLENVFMAKEHENVISQICNIGPLKINAALVSAQNRNRNFWTNISNEPYGLFNEMQCTIPHPKDRGILLRDILESEVDEKYYLSRKAVENILTHKFNQQLKGFGFGAKFHEETEKMGCLKVGGKGVDDLICVAQRGRGDENTQQLEPRHDNKTNCLTSVAKDNYIVHNMMPRSSKTGKGGTGHLSRNDGKTYCLDTGQTNAVELGYRIRRLTPIEAARLQTIPPWYKWQCSDTQQYRMLGNGWCINVITHILSYLPK